MACSSFCSVDWVGAEAEGLLSRDLNRPLARFESWKNFWNESRPGEEWEWS